VQRAFDWKPAGWRTEAHDSPEVRQVLEKLPPDRSIVRETVMAELEPHLWVLTCGCIS
jgi:hypothetical protein